LKALGKPSLLKKINKNIILNIIRNSDLVSITQLSKITGISRQTMYKTVLSLENDGFIIKSGIGESTSEGGKRPALYKFNKNVGYLIGSQIRFDKIITILTNFNSDMLSKIIIKLGDKKDFNAVLEKLFDSFNYVLKDSNILKKDLKYIGIGLHGLVNHEKGILLDADKFPNWQKEINFAGIVEKEFGVKTYIDNYCRMQVFAEKLFGIGKKYNNIVAIDTGTGLAAGVIIDNKIQRGNSYLAGEIGNTTLRPSIQSNLSDLEKKYLENFTSTDALKKKVKENIQKHKESELFKKFSNDINKIKLKDIFEAYIASEKFIEEIMDEIGGYIAIGIVNAILHYDPEITIIQGDYINAKDKFLKKVRDKVNKNLSSLYGIKINSNIQMSKLGKYIGPIGSVSLLLNQIMNLGNNTY